MSTPGAEYFPDLTFKYETRPAAVASSIIGGCTSIRMKASVPSNIASPIRLTNTITNHGTEVEPEAIRKSTHVHIAVIKRANPTPMTDCDRGTETRSRTGGRFIAITRFGAALSLMSV